MATATEIKITPEEVLKVVVSECRDLLELVQAGGSTPEERNETIRKHMAIDMSGYGIPVEEIIPGNLTEEKRLEIVNEVLARGEYN